MGLDVPAWLVALEEEVDDVLHARSQGCLNQDPGAIIPVVLLSFEDAKKQLDEWSQHQELH